MPPPLYVCYNLTMAYPGTYDINYYKGDTFEFRIYPKDTSGTAFNLSGYLPPKFTISNTRGGTEGVDGKITNIDGYAKISTEGDYILCAITPTNGAAMTLTSYVYDVEIGKKSSPYNYVYTLLSGKISVTDQVNSDPLLAAPVAPTNLVAGTATTTTIPITWTASVSEEVTGYKLYLTTDVLNPTTTTTLVATTTTPGTTSYTFTGLTTAHLYALSVTAYNAAGESTYATTTASTI